MKTPRLPLLALAALALCTGCNRKSDVKVYTAPKEREPVAEAAPPATPPEAPARAERARPKLTLQTPPDWKPAGSDSINAAKFTVAAEGGAANISITQLADFTDREALLVNMWRDQVGAEPLDAEGAAKSLSEVEVAGQKGKIFEVAGNRGGKPNRIVTAMINQGGGTWFFKLAGDEAAVDSQKPVFLEFLKRFRFPEEGRAKVEVAPKAE